MERIEFANIMYETIVFYLEFDYDGYSYFEIYLN